MDNKSDITLEELKAFWENLAGHPLTDEDMREVVTNLTAYCDLLAELSEKQGML